MSVFISLILTLLPTITEISHTPTELDVKRICQYLLFLQQQGFTVSHLNGNRAALSSVFKTLVPEEGNLGENITIEKFF